VDIHSYKRQVCEYAIKAYRQGFVAGTSGNISTLSDHNEIVITPSGVDYALITIDDIMVIDFSGNVIAGPNKPSSEWPMHAEIYNQLPGVRSIVHTHSPYATSFAVLNETIPVVLIEMVFFLGGDIRVAPLAAQGTSDVGVGAVLALRDRNACLLQNHGAVSIGKNLQEAFLRAEYTEDAAKACHLARSIGEPTLVPDEIILEALGR